jgi:putative transcriptional regulator
MSACTNVRKGLTGSDVTANALSDPDNPPLTEADLARLKPLPKARALRIRLRLTQEELATRCHIPLGTLRDWDQGARLEGRTHASVGG